MITSQHPLRIVIQTPKTILERPCRRDWAEATVVRYVKLAHSFLSQSLTWRGLDSLSRTDIVVFLLAQSERLSVGSVKGRVGELRRCCDSCICRA